MYISFIKIRKTNAYRNIVAFLKPSIACFIRCLSTKASVIVDNCRRLAQAREPVVPSLILDWHR